MQYTNESGSKVFGLVHWIKHTAYYRTYSFKETVKESAFLLEKMPQFFRNGKNTVSVSYCDKLVCHRLGTFLGIKIPTVNHLFNIFYLCGTWVKSVQDFFIMVGKDFLYYSHMFIHKLIMIQKQEKRKPLPLKIEGQGSWCAAGRFL